MNVWDIVKGVVSAVVGIGTGVIVGHYTGEAVSGSKGVYKTCATVAAVAIEGFVASKASGYMNDQIDGVRNGINRLSKKREEEDDA